MCCVVISLMLAVFSRPAFFWLCAGRGRAHFACNTSCAISQLCHSLAVPGTSCAINQVCHSQAVPVTSCGIRQLRDSPGVPLTSCAIDQVCL